MVNVDILNMSTAQRIEREKDTYHRTLHLYKRYIIKSILYPLITDNIIPILSKFISIEYLSVCDKYQGELKLDGIDMGFVFDKCRAVTKEEINEVMRLNPLKYLKDHVGCPLRPETIASVGDEVLEYFQEHGRIGHRPYSNVVTCIEHGFSHYIDQCDMYAGVIPYSGELRVNNDMASFNKKATVTISWNRYQMEPGERRFGKAHFDESDHLSILRALINGTRCRLEPGRHDIYEDIQF